MNNSELNVAALKAAHANGLAWLEQLVKNYDDGAHTLRQYIQRYKDSVATKDCATIAVISWAVNEVTNINRGGRLDLACNRSAEIAAAQVLVLIDKKMEQAGSNERVLRWDTVPHSPNVWVADVPGVGRYMIRRIRKGSKLFGLYLNAKPTRHRGTPDRLKELAQQEHSTPKD